MLQGKTSGVRSGRVGNFDVDDYRQVVNYYSTFALNDEEIPDPEFPIGYSAIAQYRAGLQKLHGWQVANHITSLGWEFVWWTNQTKDLVKLSESREVRRKRNNYEEKMDKVFAPYQAVDRFDVIENEFWSRSSRNARSAGCWLRNRYVFLHTTAGILRCESLYRAELSDFLGVGTKKDTDVHNIYIMITQIPEGKFVCLFYTCFRFVRCLFFCDF